MHPTPGPTGHVVVIPRDRSSDYLRRYLQWLMLSRDDGGPGGVWGRAPGLAEAGPDLARLDGLTPHLPGEQPTAGRFELLEHPWHRFPAGTLLYRRESDLGIILIGIPRADTASLGAERPAATPHAMAGNIDEVYKCLMDGALTFAQFAGFAMGGALGLGLAGGSSILEQVFHAMGAKQPVPVAPIIIKAMDNLLKAAQIRLAFAQFRTVYQWFTNYYHSDWEAGNLKVSPEKYAEFKANLSATLGPNSSFLTDLNLLQDEDYECDGFQLFMIYAGLHLVLLKIDLLLDTTESKIASSSTLAPLIAFFQQYDDHAGAAIKAIDRIGAERLGKVGQVVRDGGRFCFLDAGETQENENGVLYSYDDREDAESMRELHATEIAVAHELRYYGGRKDKAVEARTKWEGGLAQYRGYQAEVSKHR